MADKSPNKPTTGVSTKSGGPEKTSGADKSGNDKKTPAVKAVPESTSSTVIGKSIVIKGKLRSGEDLVVKGRIEADITSEKALFVENSGIVKAAVRVRTARISGIVVGDVVADEKIEIAADGRVVGDLTAPRIVISDGAAFRGKIDMPSAEDLARRDKNKGKGSGKDTDGPTAPSLAAANPLGDKKKGDGGDRKGPNKSPNSPVTKDSLALGGEPTK